MPTNRRFPFERNREKISLEDCFTSADQLYSAIRQYASVCRCNINEKQPRYLQQEIVSNEKNHRFDQLMNHLKQQRDNSIVDTNNFSLLRDHHIQHWKHIKNEWQNYYHEENRKQQKIFDNLIKNLRQIK